MPLMPKRVKYRKVQRGSNAGLATTNNKVDFGDFALQTLTRGYISNNQIEAARVAITRHLKTSRPCVDPYVPLPLLHQEAVGSSYG